MERALRNLQTTLILVMIGITLNAQPVPFTEVPKNSTNFVTMGDLVYFTSGDALWRTNGTAAGTFQLKAGFTVEQYRPDWLREDMPEFAREFKGDFFFVNSNSRELWRSDGASSGTILLKTSSSNNIRILDSTDDYLFFVASDASTGQELYRTDGTMSGTMIVKDINPGSADGFFGSAAVVGSELFFSANDGVHGREPWKSTGTSAGTEMIKDINPGSADGFGGTTPIGYNGLFFFTGKTPETGTDPWATDGTPEGTYILSNQTGEFEDRRSVDYEIVHDGYLYFIIRERHTAMEPKGIYGGRMEPPSTRHL